MFSATVSDAPYPDFEPKTLERFRQADYKQRIGMILEPTERTPSLFTSVAWLADLALSYKFPGRPIPKQSTRRDSRSKAGIGHFHTSTRVADFQTTIGTITTSSLVTMREHLRLLYPIPHPHPVAVHVTVTKPWPKGAKPVFQNQKSPFVITRPDAANGVGAVLDGMNRVAYDDDRQVSVLNVAKMYDDDGPFTQVDVMPAWLFVVYDIKRKALWYANMNNNPNQAN